MKKGSLCYLIGCLEESLSESLPMHELVVAVDVHGGGGGVIAVIIMDPSSSSKKSSSCFEQTAATFSNPIFHTDFGSIWVT